MPKTFVDLVRTVPQYKWWCIQAALRLATYTAFLVIMPVYGARAFGHCSDKEKAEGDDDCRFDYVTFNLYFGLSFSLNNFIGYVCGSIAGRFGDTYGRVPLAAMHGVNGLIAFAPLLGGRQMIVVWLVLYPFKAIWSSAFIPLNAAITDMVDEEDKTVAISLGGASSYSGVFLGAFVAFASFQIDGLGGLPQVLCILLFNLIQATFTFLFCPETVHLHREKLQRSLEENQTSTLDGNGDGGRLKQVDSVANAHDDDDGPNSSLLSSLRTDDLDSMSFTKRYLLCGEWILLFNVDGLMYWLCRIEGLFWIVRGGMNATGVTYYLQVAGINNQSRASRVSLMIVITLALSSVACLGFVIPYLKNRVQMNDVDLLIVGFIFLIIAMICWMMSPIPGITGLVMTVVGAACLGLSNATSVSSSRITPQIIRNPDQTAAAFGIMNSWLALSSSIGPAVFAGFLAFVVWIGLDWMFPVPAITLCLLSLYLVKYKLRPGMEKLQLT